MLRVLSSTWALLLGVLLLMALSAGIYLFRRLDSFHSLDKEEWQNERQEMKELLAAKDEELKKLREHLITRDAERRTYDPGLDK